jgi:adenine nucleotide transporter 17
LQVRSLGRGERGFSCPHAFSGTATTIISNPIWVIQTSQAVQTMSQPPSSTSVATDASVPKPVVIKKLNIAETISHLLRTGGVGEFWRGVGPALVLVMNPVLQYTVFEQLKNWLVRRRKGRGASGALTDIDFFLLGALSKLGKLVNVLRALYH